MKILFVQHVADVYGSSRSLLRLSGQLVKDGHEVAVALQEEGPLRDALASAGARVHPVPDMPVLHRSRLKSPPGLAALLGALPAGTRSFRRLIEQVKPDLVHTNNATILPAAGAAARAAGLPHIQHIRESFLDFGLLWKVYRVPIVHYSTRLVCISEFIAGTFTPAQRRERIDVIHNGIPREEFDGVTEAERAAFRSRWGLKGPVVALVGRIKLQRKGQDVLARAAALLKDKHPDAQYLLVGSPFPGNENHLEALQRMIGAAGLTDRFILTGHLSDPRVALASCDVSIMASAQPEPLGNVTIESMAFGKPVIGTRCGGTAELLRDNDTGLLVPPDDPAALAAALDRLLSDETARTRMGARARDYYLAQLEFRPFYNRMMQTYETVLTRRKRQAP